MKVIVSKSLPPEMGATIRCMLYLYDKFCVRFTCSDTHSKNSSSALVYLFTWEHVRSKSLVLSVLAVNFF